MLHVEILWQVGIAKDLVYENVKRVPFKVFSTFDTWTSAPGDPYILLTAHYIDSPPDYLNVWNLKSKQLLFQVTQGQHTGNNMGEILCHALEQYRLHDKVMWCNSSPFPFIFGIPTAHYGSSGWLVHEQWCYVTVGTFARLGLGSSVMKLEKSGFGVGLRVLSSK
jgi:hypothetical protein